MDTNFHNFVELWYRSGRFRRSAAGLLDIAEAAGVQLDGDNLRARQTRLGLLISKYSGQAIVIDGRIVCVRRCSPYHGRMAWKLIGVTAAVEGLRRKAAKLPVTCHPGKDS